MVRNGKYTVESDAEGAYLFMLTFFNINRVQNQTGIVLKRDDEIIAAALYIDYNGTNVVVHLAGTPGRRWLNRDFLKWMFHYPFEQLKCVRITSWVDETNVDSRRFVEHIGAKHEATLSKAGTGGQDLLLYAMFKEDCRYV